MYASLQYGARERIYNYCVVDIETTGLSPEQNQIIELSAIRVRDGKIVDRFSELVNPHCGLSASITALTGITDDMLRDARCIETVLPEFLAFIGNDVIIGHNVCFDLSFIDRAASEFGTHNFDCKYIDTLQISRRVHPELAHHRLSDMVDHYCINCETAHRALADCESTYNVYERLFEEIALNPELATQKIKRKATPCPEKVQPNYPEGYLECKRAEKYRKAGYIQTALSVLDEAKSKGYAAPDLYESYAIIYRKLKDYQKEIDILNEILSTEEGKGLIYLAERRDKAIELQQREIAQQQKNAEKLRISEEKKRIAAEKAAKKEQERNLRGDAPIKRAVLQIKDGIVICSFESIAEASRNTGIDKKGIREVAKGRQNHAGGFVWKYADET